MASKNQPLLLEATAASEATGWRRNQHLINAMPYIDTLNDQQKQEVGAMLEHEVHSCCTTQTFTNRHVQMRTSAKTPKDYLNELPAMPPSVITVRTRHRIFACHTPSVPGPRGAASGIRPRGGTAGPQRPRPRSLPHPQALRGTAQQSRGMAGGSGQCQGTTTPPTQPVRDWQPCV